MKKIMVACTCLGLALSLAGCGSAGQSAQGADRQSQAVTTEESSASRTSHSPENGDRHRVHQTPEKGGKTSLSGILVVSDLPPIPQLTGNSQQSLPVTYTDATGTAVTITDTSRIIGLDVYAHISTALVALGMKNNLVARDRSTTDPQLRKLPVVNKGGMDINAEAVLAARPTLVIADERMGRNNELTKIREAGIPVAIVKLSTKLGDSGKNISTIAHIVGRDAAGAEVAQTTDRMIAKASTKAQQLAASANKFGSSGRTQPRMLVLLTHGGKQFFPVQEGKDAAHDLITALGGVDAAQEIDLETHGPITAEALVAANPDVIITMSRGLERAGGVPALLNIPGVSATTAGAQQNIIALPDSVALSGGPLSAPMITRAATLLYGK